MPSERPNILVVMVDEHAPQASSVYGHPYVATPHLERLADGGVVFEQAYCPSPLCVPSRMSFMSGRAVHRIGVWDNASALGSDTPTFAHALRAGGYETVLCGKMHFMGPDQMHGFEQRLVEDCCDSVVTWVPRWEHGIGTAAGALARLQQAGPDDQSEANVYDDLVETRARAYLKTYSRSGQARPFLLLASFNAPHFPLSPRREFYQAYIDRVTPPALPPPGASAPHPTVADLWRYFLLDQATESMQRRARAAYFALVTQTDARLGRILQTLDGLRFARPVVVVYVADHGEMMGEHGLWWKCNFYEESVRVPLVVSWPGVFAPRRERMPVTLTDLTRTLASLAGVEMGDVDGVDLRPCLEGMAGDAGRTVFSEYHAHGVTQPTCMVRQGRYKLVFGTKGSVRLFDLETDAHEWFDLAQAPALAEVREALQRIVWSRWPADIEAQVLCSQRRRQLITDAHLAAPGPQSHPWGSIGG